MYDAHLTGKKHKKAAAALLEKGVTAITPELKEEARKAKDEEERNRDKPIAFAELLIKKYAEILEPQLDDTIANVERKQTLTPEELEKVCFCLPLSRNSLVEVGLISWFDSCNNKPKRSKSVKRRKKRRRSFTTR